MQDVTATDPSRVETAKVDGNVKEEPRPPYTPFPPGECINDKWKFAGKNATLVCATKEVFLAELASQIPARCKEGEPIVVTLDATIRIEGPRFDLGWYVATDGGDAMNGKCVLNDLHTGGSYPLVSPSNNATAVGKTVWSVVDGGDDDKCGDVFLPSNETVANMRTPFVMNSTLTCTDENDDGFMDIAVCFTWRSAQHNGVCDPKNNIPGAATSGCYCTRYDIPNIPVGPEDPEKACK
jgi:hypothetical protein